MRAAAGLNADAAAAAECNVFLVQVDGLYLPACAFSSRCGAEEHGGGGTAFVGAAEDGQEGFRGA